jgi:hypothetical protein
MLGQKSPHQELVLVLVFLFLTSIPSYGYDYTSRIFISPPRHSVFPCPGHSPRPRL